MGGDDSQQIAALCRELRRLERTWGPRIGFGLAAFTSADLIAWGCMVGLHVIEWPAARHATIREINHCRQVYINPGLPEGEKCMTIGHELCHMVRRNYTDELLATAFAHCCRIPHHLLRAVAQEDGGALSAARVHIRFAPWRMATDERAAKAAIERAVLYNLMEQHG